MDAAVDREHRRPPDREQAVARDGPARHAPARRPPRTNVTAHGPEAAGDVALLMSMSLAARITYSGRGGRFGCAAVLPRLLPLRRGWGGSGAGVRGPEPAPLLQGAVPVRVFRYGPQTGCGRRRRLRLPQDHCVRRRAQPLRSLLRATAGAISEPCSEDFASPAPSASFRVLFAMRSASTASSTSRPRVCTRTCARAADVRAGPGRMSPQARRQHPHCRHRMRVRRTVVLAPAAVSPVAAAVAGCTPDTTVRVVITRPTTAAATRTTAACGDTNGALPGVPPMSLVKVVGWQCGCHE